MTDPVTPPAALVAVLAAWLGIPRADEAACTEAATRALRELEQDHSNDLRAWLLAIEAGRLIRDDEQMVSVPLRLIRNLLGDLGAWGHRRDSLPPGSVDHEETLQHMENLRIAAHLHQRGETT